MAIQPDLIRIYDIIVIPYGNILISHGGKVWNFFRVQLNIQPAALNLLNSLSYHFVFQTIFQCRRSSDAWTQL